MTTQAWRQTPRLLGISAWAIVIVAIAVAVLGFAAITAGVVSFAPAKVAAAGVQMRPVENQAPVQAPVVVQAPAPAPQAPVPAVSQDNGAVAPAPANWPIRTGGVWTYTNEVIPIPPGIDWTYSGRAYDPQSGGDNAGPIRLAIAKKIMPNITDNDLATLSIIRNPDNRDVVLAALYIIRNGMLPYKVKTVAESNAIRAANPEREETHLFLSLDNGNSWEEQPLSFAPNPNTIVIDHVIVTGADNLISIRPFSSPGYWQLR